MTLLAAISEPWLPQGHEKHVAAAAVLVSMVLALAAASRSSMSWNSIFRKSSRRHEALAGSIGAPYTMGAVFLAIFFQGQPRIDMSIFSGALGGLITTVIVIVTFIAVVAFIITELSGPPSYEPDL